MSTNDECRWATEPFIMGAPEQFARLRTWLTQAGFTEEALCAKANVRTVAHFSALGPRRTVLTQAVDVQSLLVLLFLDSKSADWDVVRSILSPDGLATLTDLGLLQSSVSDPGLCAAPVALIPWEGLYLVSDRLGSLETIGEGTPSDLVYSPITSETARFVGLMPRVPCENYLEICGGTGVAALIAARDFAQHAYSADITERSTRFARFNGALNGLENFTAVQGDLYEPVAGRTFDLITAHPPYVPAAETEMVFRDGGQDGEQITRRIIAGLEDYLRPGGQFYLDCVLTDRIGDALEERIRRMLGPAEDEFDVVLIRSGTVDPRIYHAQQLQARRMTPEAFHAQVELFKRLGIEEFVASTVLMQRRPTPRPVVTRHRMLTGETRADHLQWLLQYMSGTVEWDVDDPRWLDSRPRTVAHTELRVRSVSRAGEWAALDARVSTRWPFAVESPCPPLVATLLARCDGQMTAREHLARLRAEGAIPQEKTEADFVQLLRELADAPYVELDLYPIPSGVAVNGPVRSGV